MGTGNGDGCILLFSCLVSLVAITTGIIIRDSVTQSNAEVNIVDRV